MADSDSSYWQELEDLFQTASDLDPETRARLLDERRAEQPELVAEVESLLASSEAAGDHLEQAIGDGFRMAAQDAAQGEPERQRIGVYRVLGELGRGGLSVVYLAERDDDAYRKEVAIKVVKRGMDTREILLRLHQERQILASLDHPYIARILDGGSTDDGLPYFVMERIQGEPIDEYCDRHDLGIRQRLELFRKVCSAVQFAHQNLVVHRDIKPGNLLVTEDGTPKLLDFGIAKLLDPEHPGAAFTATAAGLRLLTPSFASPEQIQGRPLTTSTDVYSLGVLLYLLLTGQPPYRFSARGLTEIERVICDEIPERPSSVVRQSHDLGTAARSEEASAPSLKVASARLARSLRGDLDKIVLMALRKEPQRRYASVEQLSADIGRYLGNLPVRARPDTFTYRTQKFLRRHRIGLAAGFLILVSLLAGLAATLWQARRAQQNFERAEIERAKGEEVTEFLMGLFEVSSPDRSLGETISAREILDRGSERIRQDLKNDPELRAALMDVMGTVYYNLGLYDRAESLLLEALEINEAVSGNDPTTAAIWSHLGSVRRKQGRLEEAEDLFRRALALNRRLYGEPHPRIAEALNNLAAARFHRNDPERAEDLFRQALEMRLQLDPPDYQDLAETQNNLAVVLYQRGDLESAEAFSREALKTRRSYFGDVHPLVANSLNNLASLLNRQDRPGEAEQIFREVVEMQEKLLGEEHPELAPSLNNLAAAQLAQGSAEEAEQNYRRALEITLQAKGEENNEVATFRVNLANLLVERGETAEAAAFYRSAIRAREASLGPGHPWLANPMLRLARILQETETAGSAEPWLRRTIEILSDEEEPREVMLAEARCLLGADLLALDRKQDAAVEIQACLPILAASREESDPLLRASSLRLQQLEGKISSSRDASQPPP